MDPGERISAAAIRETKEETGIDCEITGLVGIYTNPRRPSKPILTLSDLEIDQITSQPGMLSQEGMGFTARGVQFVLPPGQEIYPSHQFVTRMIIDIWGDRPIYFAATTNVQFDLGLYPYTERQGMAFKLVTPQEAAESSRWRRVRGLRAMVGWQLGCFSRAHAA